MTAISNLFNREAAATVVLDEKDSERLLASVAAKQGKVMVEAGYATYIASKSLTNARMAEIFGKSTSTVTLYRRAGKFLVLGGEPTGDLWRVLTSKSKANDKRVASVIDSEDATVQSIEAVTWEHFRKDGKPVVPTTPVATPNSDGLTPVQEADAMLKRLDVLIRQFDAEQFATIETSLNAMIARQVKRLTAAAKADSTAGAAA